MAFIVLGLSFGAIALLLRLHRQHPIISLMGLVALPTLSAITLLAAGVPPGRYAFVLSLIGLASWGCAVYVLATIIARLIRRARRG